MARRIWIVKKKKKLTQADFNAAEAHGCSEVANGIPPILQGIIAEGMLPCAYEEPESPIPEPPCSTHISIIEAIDPAKARPVRVKRVWEGRDYFYDCLVSQNVKDGYVAGKIAIGDYVEVHFTDMEEQIVAYKIYKSWKSGGTL